VKRLAETEVRSTNGTPTDRTLDQRQLARLLEVGRALVSDLDLEHVLRAVLEAARELTDARYAAIGVIDDQRRELERFVFVGIDEETQRRIGHLPRGHGILGELIRNPKPLRLDRISDHPHSYGFPAGHPPMTTFAGAPVMIRGEAYGNIYLSEKGNGAAFDEADEAVLVLLSEWAAVAIENARLYESAEADRRDLQRVVRGLEATAYLSRDVGGETDPERVRDLIAKRARALVDARLVVLLLADGDALRVAACAGEGGDALIDRLVPIEGPLRDNVLAGTSERRAVVPGAPLETLGLAGAQILLVPLRSRGERAGLLVAAQRLDTPSGEFSADDELVLNSLAAAATSALSANEAIQATQLQLAIQASERERARWARELHDETLQELGAMRLSQAAALKAADIEQMRDALRAAGAQTERTIASLEGLIRELRPAALDQLGVEAALESLAERLTDREGLRVDIDVSLASGDGSGSAAPRLDPELEATIYRVTQEALNNVAKHAEADGARVAVVEEDDHVRVIVEDDGKGMTAGNGGGFGLIGMRERVSLAGGELEIGPGGRGGTRITARLPVSRA
jgi:signal transduction histidine kinase